MKKLCHVEVWEIIMEERTSLLAQVRRGFVTIDQAIQKFIGFTNALEKVELITENEASKYVSDLTGQLIG